MKIALLVSSMNAGGAERVAATLCNAWASQGHHVLLMPTYPVKGHSFYPLASNVRVEWLADRLGAGARSWRSPFLKLCQMRRFVSDEQPDVVVSFLTNVNVMTLLATWGLTVPVVVCERTNPAFSDSSGPVLSMLRRWLYRRAAAVCVQTQATASAFAQMVPHMPSLDVLPNPMPPELDGMALSSLMPDDSGRFRLVAMGRFMPNKQFDRLIDMFSRIHTDFPQWDLYIFGDGPMREGLELKVQQMELSGRVHMPGRTTSPWIELQKASAFVMTSSVEGFPNVLLEAMALGLPAVVYDCPSGPRELTEDGQHAVLVALGDEDKFVAGLRTLLGDAAQRQKLGKVAAQSVRARFSLPAVVKQWGGVLSRVTKHND
ncbi:glycosyltransferase family 4 protein [Pusillimonas minor]|uniref:Glycosyltransferase family 4 protein n=1 Tax=Pusillimonas minor TaxID=2697024 RepID=A0A842HTI0_9BURK|nr:glycosyltransferase family 4 protein [Pusillimonas minor]MBC2770948.1 glycosyltransferase family 4 protein [Pusillimonas minor]